MKKKSVIIMLCVAVVMLSACGGQPTANNTTTTPSNQQGGPAASQEQQPPSGSTGEIVLHYPSFEIGVNSSAPVLAEVVKRFNAEYAGKIRIEIEEIPGDQAYADKMKILLAADDLPHIINNKCGQNLLDMFVERNAIADLTPYFDADPEWRATIDDYSWEINSRNGKIYAVPDEKSLIGYFYNKELFAQAGVTPARTWDEFWEVCEALLAAGITPFAMDTDDTAWLTNLWTGPILASKSDAGFRFMKTFQPTNYNFPEFIDTLADIQKMFLNYTTRDAVGGKYENGANNFLSGQVAMIANGPWMIGDFIEVSSSNPGFIDKIGSEIFPGGIVHDMPMVGYSIGANADQATLEAAMEAIKFFTKAEIEQMALEMVGRMPVNVNVKISDEMKANNRLLGELVDRSSAATVRIDPFQDIWFPNVCDAISTNYPNLATGRATPEEIANILTMTAELN